jgi:hypothetical protein
MSDTVFADAVGAVSIYESTVKVELLSLLKRSTGTVEPDRQAILVLSLPAAKDLGSRLAAMLCPCSKEREAASETGSDEQDWSMLHQVHE